MFTADKGGSIENESGQGAKLSSFTAGRVNTAQVGPEWAGLQGLSCTVEAGEGTFCVNGELVGHPWRLERAPASRDYLVGEELRGRAEIGISPQVTVVLMNRALKETLEKRAYSLYTDTLETQASPVLTEEMRWLALYPEAGWDSLSDAFFHRYAILAERRADAGIITAAGKRRQPQRTTTTSLRRVADTHRTHHLWHHHLRRAA